MNTTIQPPCTVFQHFARLALAAATLLGLSPGTHADVITDWNATAIQVIKAVNPNPLPASRALAMMHVAQFDAVNAVVRCYQPYAADLSMPSASPEAGAAQAAYRVLTNLYPTQLAVLDAALDASLGAVFFEQAKADGIALGNATAAAILARRSGDGSATPMPYTPGTGPGVWIPTPPANAPALLPHWRNVTPFTMSSPAQFRPGPPPALDSAIYTADFNEIKTLGDTNSAMRTAEQTVTALFHIEFVPYTLGSAARYAVEVHPLPLVESARLFALLNLAMADSFISVWDAKFEYNYWRPVTAIRAADTDGNPATAADATWTPLRATPPHPEYPAAHTIAAGAGAEVLASVFGDAFFFTIESPTLPGQPRTFARFSDFPLESGNARVWAGFHWRSSCLVGAQMGAAIGRQAVANYLRSTKPPTFTKITEGEIVNDGGRSAGVAWGDYDNDGFEDLFVANNNGENDFLYHNNGDGTFTRITSGDIVNDGGDSVSANWGDFDNDGDLDLFVSNGGGFGSPKNNFLYRNDGDGTFTRIVTGSIVSDLLYTLPSAWGDFDNDGWLDLFTGNWFGVHALYRNTGTGSFTRVTTNAIGLDPALGDSNGCSWGDYDNDGRLDLFVANGGGGPQPHFLYRNLGHGAFTKITSGCIVTEPMVGIGGAWGDYDNDGFLDLFTTQQSGNSQRRNRLYHNNGAGGFECITSGPTGTDTGFGTGCAWGDYDNDGFLDLFVCWQEGKNNHLYHNNGDGTFTQILEGSPVNDGGRSPGCAWADYDNDGFLDLFVSNGAFVGSTGEDNFLYRNDGNGNRWLKLKLVGGPSNRAAIGAKVRVTATMGGNQRQQMREISGGSGFASQNSVIAHFGLAGATHAELVRIEWPSGTVQELRNVIANQFLTITEPPRLSSPRIESGQFRFTLRGARGLAYTIQRSTNALDWTAAGSLTVTDVNGTAEFSEPLPAGNGSRLYRAVAP
jgi:hypothetical protein